MNTSLATKRIYHEYKDCIFDDINIKIDINEKNMFIWNILIVPNDGFYKDVPLNFELHFPDEYPLTYKIPKLYTPYIIKHTNYRIVRFTDELTQTDTIKYEFVICDGAAWYCDLLNIKALLTQLYWYFNIKYLLKTNEKQSAYFKSKDKNTQHSST